MKKILFSFLLFTCCNKLIAQLTITPGAQLYITGAAQLTLNNTDFVNNGTFTQGSSMVSFTGNTPSSISGSQSTIFYGLEINKTEGSSVSLQRFVLTTQQVNFVAGYLNLNNFNLGLGSTGVLNNEQETSRVIGPNGGRVVFNGVLNAPNFANPGNLGAIITSTQNMGNVAIGRGHQSQINSFGNGNSIHRYYDIIPTNNTALNATLRFHYFDAELNGLPEAGLQFWKSSNNTSWSYQGFNSSNTITNYVEKTGIADFSRWTLSTPNNPLPVQFTLFNVKCEGDNVIIKWKTAQEQNSSHFNIERSTDGINWTVISNLPAAGNSNTERSYLFTDNNPVQKSFYRIAQYDIDGRVQYSSILRASCNAADVFSVWPNPFTEKVFINISTAMGSKMVIKVFDTKGTLVKIQTTSILQGSNLIQVDLKNMASGIYQLAAEWNNGQMKKNVQVIKQ